MAAPLTLKQKVFGGVGLAIAVVAAMAIASVLASIRARGSAERVNHTHEVIEQIIVVEMDALDVESAQRGFVITDSETFLQPFAAATTRLGADLDSLRRSVSDNPGQGARADSLGRVISERIALLALGIQHMKNRHPDSAILVVRGGRGRTLMDSARAIAARMMAVERSLLAERAQREEVHRRQEMVITIVAFVTALAVAIVLTVTVLRDIEQREAMVRQVADTARREQAANQAKSEFLARMSHELRTPLNSVIGFANVLLKNKSKALEAKDLAYIDRIRANGTHLLGIINNILDLSKVESGRMDVEVTQVDVPELVREAVAVVGETAVPVEVDLPLTVLPMRTDRDKLKQVLVNLIANAVKFTERGRVVVRIVPDARSREVRRIDVIDSGIGIPPDRLTRIFEAFEQAEATTTRRFGGTGLGLAIAKSMCERLGCRLTVVSKEGVGSTFSILVAVDERPLISHLTPGGGVAVAPQVTSETRLPGISAQSTVLVIDDSADALTLLQQLVEEEGARVVTADSGERGLALAQEVHPDLILLDLIMPGVDGWEVLRRLKAQSSTASIPVVVVSIVASEQRGGVLGAVDLVDKPVSRDALLDAIKRNLDPTTARVLIVDDGESSRSVFEELLQDFTAVEVRTAETGKDALARMADFEPQIVILDLMLPDIDGLEILRRIREMPGGGDVHVIVATARSLSATEKADIERQALTVLTKDMEIADHLRRTLRTTLRQIRTKETRSS